MEFSRYLLSTVCKLRLLLVRTVLLTTIIVQGAQLTLVMTRASLRTTQLLITLFLIMTVILTLVFSNTEFRPLRREVIRRNSRKIVIVTLTPLLFLLMTLLKIRIIILGQVAIRKALTRLISVSKFLVVGALWYRIILLVVVPSLLFSVRTVKYGAWRKIAVHLAPTSQERPLFISFCQQVFVLLIKIVRAYIGLVMEACLIVITCTWEFTRKSLFPLVQALIVRQTIIRVTLTLSHTVRVHTHTTRKVERPLHLTRDREEIRDLLVMIGRVVRYLITLATRGQAS